MSKWMSMWVSARCQPGCQMWVSQGCQKRAGFRSGTAQGEAVVQCVLVSISLVGNYGSRHE